MHYFQGSREHRPPPGAPVCELPRTQYNWVRDSADSKICLTRPILIKIKVKECCHKNNLFAKPKLLAAF